jgi:hypothetical protein
MVRVVNQLSRMQLSIASNEQGLAAEPYKFLFDEVTGEDTSQEDMFAGERAVCACVHGHARGLARSPAVSVAPGSWLSCGSRAMGHVF